VSNSKSIDSKSSVKSLDLCRPPHSLFLQDVALTAQSIAAPPRRFAACYRLLRESRSAPAVRSRRRRLASPTFATRPWPPSAFLKSIAYSAGQRCMCGLHWVSVVLPDAHGSHSRFPAAGPCSTGAAYLSAIFGKTSTSLKVRKYGKHCTSCSTNLG
jgi:hypothetical protein